MNNVRNGVHSVLLFVFLAGLVVVVIALFNGQTSGSAVPNVSPVVTPVGNVGVSPLSTPNAPHLAQVGEPVLLGTSGFVKSTNQFSNKVVSITGRGDQGQAVLIDLVTGAKTTLTNKPSRSVSSSERWTVYEDRPQLEASGSNSWISVVNNETRKEMALGNKDSFQQEPSISEDVVVWTDWQNWANSQIEIHGYDLKTGKQIPVVTGPGVRRLPTVSGQWVLYVQKLASDPRKKDYVIELRAHSLKNNEDYSIGLIPAPDNASWGTHFAVDGDKVLWVKANDASVMSSELHLYDLVTRKDRRLTEPTNQTPMDVSVSSRSKLAVYNTPAGKWTFVDWVSETPALIPIAQPAESPVNPMIVVSGDYLVWRYADGKIYSALVTR